eukprot:SAG31_NODE_4641_length_3078_cov_5.138301_1_plen_43_part_00
MKLRRAGTAEDLDPGGLNLVKVVLIPSTAVLNLVPLSHFLKC